MSMKTVKSSFGIAEFLLTNGVLNTEKSNLLRKQQARPNAVMLR